MATLTFAHPGNVTTFQQQLEYINTLTDVGAGPMLGLIFLILLGGIIFLTTKAFGIEKSAGTTFFICGILAIFLRIMRLINNGVLSISIILAVLGIYLLVKESSQYSS